MSILSYFKASFARKKARRVFQQYGTRIDTFQLANNEKIEFANWLNPLLKPKVITQHEVDFFRKYIPEGSMAIDIGANIGDLTVAMAIAAGGSGKVLALDPNPHVFSVLQENAKLNKGKANIIPLQFAAADRDMNFYYASSEASMSNGGLITDLNDNRHGKYKLKEPIKGKHLGNFLEQEYQDWLPKLSLIKIDTEGLDYFVLTTLERILEKYHPVIIAEIFLEIPVSMRNDIFDLLKKYGYTLLNAGLLETDKPMVTRPVNTKEEMPKVGQTENIIAYKA
ncbi:FkbM family methyltransferase [Chitinophaga sp. YIM B06452]|uniref:FkbM family methyltransferase n=1 Tax=Chitinophaga sp. YIM B06452 TaxID=3082158 RepID=UPI0031FEDF40